MLQMYSRFTIEGLMTEVVVRLSSEQKQIVPTSQLFHTSFELLILTFDIKWKVTLPKQKVTTGKPSKGASVCDVRKVNQIKSAEFWHFRYQLLLGL